MIFYFSGTGNSRYCAKWLAHRLGDEAVDALRRRRLGFYARAGLRQAGFRTKIFGVPFIVLLYGPEISDEALMKVAQNLYRDGVGDPDLYEKNVLIPYDPEAV